MSLLTTRLNQLLETFNIQNDKKHDIEWLNKNVAIGNTGHRDLPEVQKIIVQLLSEKNKQREHNFLRNKLK